MLETNSKYSQVGAFCDSCDQCYPVYRNLDTGAIVYENDDTCDQYLFTEINGSDDMQDTSTEAISGFITNGYATGLRGAILFVDGTVLGIYLMAEDTYGYGIQHISKYFAGVKPALTEIEIEPIE